MLETAETELGRIDEALIVIQSIRQQRLKTIKNIEKRVDITENQKIFIGDEYKLWRAVKVLTDQVEQQIKFTLGKVPPNAQDLEETVVGAILLESRPKAMPKLDGTTETLPAALDMVRGFLLPDHFYDDRLARIYRACLTMKGSVDMRTINEALRRSGEIEVIGGSIYLGEITSKVSSSANIEYHARTVVEYAMRRQMIMGASYIMENAYLSERDPFVLLKYAKKVILKVESWIR